ncbi:MAG: hypothetical protein WD595_03560 [Waddliaceae bacterium]
MNFINYCTTQIEGQGRVQDFANLTMAPWRALIGGRECHVINKNLTVVNHSKPFTTAEKVVHVAKVTFAIIGTLLIVPLLICTICKLAAIDDKSWKLSQVASLMKKANLHSLPINKHSQLLNVAKNLQRHTNGKGSKLLTPEIVFHLDQWENLTDKDLQILNSEAYRERWSEIDDFHTLVKLANALLEIDDWRDPNSHTVNLLFTFHNATAALMDLPKKTIFHLLETARIWEKQRGCDLNTDEKLKLTDLYHNFHFTSSHESVIRTYNLIHALEWGPSFLNFESDVWEDVNANTIHATRHLGLLSAPNKINIAQEVQAEIDTIDIREITQIAGQLDLDLNKQEELRGWIEKVSEPQKRKVDSEASALTKKYLKMIIYKFREEGTDKKFFIEHILEKKRACTPTWVEVTRSTMEKLYGVSGVRQQLLTYIQDIKDGIFLSTQGKDWHVLSHARKHFGKQIGLNVEAGESDGFADCIGNKSQKSLLEHFNKEFTLVRLISALLTKIHEDNSLETRTEIQEVLFEDAYAHYLKNKRVDDEVKEEKEEFNDYVYVPETFFDKKNGISTLLNPEGLIELLIRTKILDKPEVPHNSGSRISNVFRSIFNRIF